MNNHENYFRQKFLECGKYLNVEHTKLVSLKYREMRNHQYYTEVLEYLKKVNGINIKDLGNTLNGHAYHISVNDQNVVIVEHETGLEILYIAGSIAGIIGLILQISSMIGNHRRHSNYFFEYFEEVEIRYFDDNGKFIEEHKQNYLPYEMFLPPQNNNKEIELLKKKVENLEKKVRILSKKEIIYS